MNIEYTARKLANYKQLPGINYFSEVGSVNGVFGLWATYFLDPNYMMTGFFKGNNLMYLELEDNIEPNTAFPRASKPKIDYFKGKSFCLALLSKNKEPLLEKLNPEDLDKLALTQFLSSDNLRGTLTETSLKDPNTPLSRTELILENHFLEDKEKREFIFNAAKTNMLHFLAGETANIKINFPIEEKALTLRDVKLDFDGVRLETDEKNPILRFADSFKDSDPYEVTVTKREGSYEVETRNADLEYAGAEADPEYHDVFSSEKDVCLAFSKRCAELARNIGRNESAVFLVQRAAYKKAEEVLLGGRSGNGGETKTQPVRAPAPKKKPKTMER